MTVHAFPVHLGTVPPLPLPLPGDASPADLLAVLEVAYRELRAMRARARSIEANIAREIQSGHVQLDCDHTRADWFDERVAPLLETGIYAPAWEESLRTYVLVFYNLPDLVPAWTGPVAKLKSFLAEYRALRRSLEATLIDPVFDAELSRRRAGGQPRHG